MIEDNTVVGNANGIVLAAGVQGNIIRGNLIAGNPPVQLSIDFPLSTGVDIRNMAADGANTFENNVCLSSVNAPCPAIGIPPFTQAGKNPATNSEDNTSNNEEKRHLNAFRMVPARRPCS
jgi:parallel beta-helix repeat protein